MKKFTFSLTFLFLLISTLTSFAQKVVIIGINHATPDGFSFVAAENLAVNDEIFFTENEYSDAGGSFVDNTEAVVKFTVTSQILKGNVVYVEETGVSTNIFTVSTSSGAGTAVKTASSGSFSLSSGGEAFYAYAETAADEDPTNGVSEIYSVLFTGSGEAPVATGGSIPADLNPVNDYPNAVVIDGFVYASTPAKLEFNPNSITRTNVSKAILQNTSNYVSSATNSALSTQFFTNFNLAGSNPSLTVSASPSSLYENSGSSITYTFTLSAAATSNITVNFSVGGTATFSTDYTQSGAATFNASSGTVTILNGNSTASFTVSPVGDTNLEPDETVVLTIAPGTGYDAGSPGAASTTIMNDDAITITPLVAVTGLNHTTNDGFSFVALDTIYPGTSVYFTENSFDNNSLSFTGTEAVFRWVPGAGVSSGKVFVV